MPFQLEFDPGAIISFALLYVVSSVEVLGDTAALTKVGLDRQPTDRETAAEFRHISALLLRRTTGTARAHGNRRQKLLGRRRWRMVRVAGARDWRADALGDGR